MAEIIISTMSTKFKVIFPDETTCEEFIRFLNREPESPCFWEPGDNDCIIIVTVPVFEGNSSHAYPEQRFFDLVRRFSIENRILAVKKDRIF